MSSTRTTQSDPPSSRNERLEGKIALLKRNVASLKHEIELGSLMEPQLVKEMEQQIERFEQLLQKHNSTK